MSSTSNNNNNQTSANPDDNNNNTAPSLITSHASYAVGAAESTIGSLTSNASLQQSGESTKHQAVEDMRAADNGSTTTTTTTQGGSGSAGGLAAKAEEAVGGIVGCGGLQDKGAQAQAKEGKVKEA
ncbi:hypothetical protein IWZ00DRAFT_543991 [Phyllosticta capitalensis]|uniref:Uncharacterized protein n=1 Tax=Phyllosticta capitalensis TaxID=121624 RepID=A0ABR1YVE5_9PEZI